MNCKQGDLAVFVKSSCWNEGKILTCIRYAGHIPTITRKHQHLWETDVPVRWNSGAIHNYAPDAYLRPLRGDDITEREVTELYTPQEPITVR